MRRRIGLKGMLSRCEPFPRLASFLDMSCTLWWPSRRSNMYSSQRCTFQTLNWLSFPHWMSWKSVLKTWPTRRTSWYFDWCQSKGLFQNFRLKKWQPNHLFFITELDRFTIINKLAFTLLKSYKTEMEPKLNKPQHYSQCQVDRISELEQLCK
jgi:hypothetical protein